MPGWIEPRSDDQQQPGERTCDGRDIAGKEAVLRPSRKAGAPG